MRGDAPRRRTLQGPVPCEPALEVAVLPASGGEEEVPGWSEHPGTNGMSTLP